MFIARTKRAFVNVLLVYIVLINEHVLAQIFIVRSVYLRVVPFYLTILNKNEAETRQTT